MLRRSWRPCSAASAGLVTSVLPLVQIDDYCIRLAVITGVSAVVWLIVMVMTRQSPTRAGGFCQTGAHQVRDGRSEMALWSVPHGDLACHGRRPAGQRCVVRRPAGTGAFLLHQQLMGWSRLVLLVLCLLMQRRFVAATSG